MVTPPIPANLTATLDDLLHYGWSFRVEHAEDTDRAPFIRVLAIRRDGSERIETTWHSRETGGQRYRWRSAFHDGAPIKSLIKIRDIITDRREA